MRLWRIATETRKYPAKDLSGTGAAVSPGRWNDDGEHVVYSSPTIALAVLETAAHVDTTGLPLNRFLVAIDVPDGVWNARKSLTEATLPPTWAGIPPGVSSVQIGSDWLKAGTSAILMVPSVIVPEEFNTLINPKHPDSSGITAKPVRPFQYNQLFRA